MSQASRNLWFVIEQAVSEINELCAQAKATELRALQRANEGAWLPTTSPRADTVTGDETEGGGFGTSAKSADLVSLRAELRERLQSLREQLSHRLTEREVYYCLFPVVIYSDELVHSAVGDRSQAWAPLQQELYDVDNGGELFYTLIDTLLAKSETLPLIFEVFYFCLRDGFVGIWENNSNRRDEYMSRLELRIPLKKVAPSESEGVDFDASVELVPFPKSYYAIAAGTMIGFFSVLQFLGRF